MPTFRMAVSVSETRVYVTEAASAVEAKERLEDGEVIEIEADTVDREIIYVREV